ncbi:MAG TPA: ArsR family transcriptional regulator [Candidatus Nanoarchaeia archaeon]|nr:ArsR family transcriptional regulator [Candidatus Nanoarchaeia archaeon]
MTHLALELETRKRLYSLIEQFPGTHFRELHRLFGGGTGNLEHHLRFLDKKGLIQVEKDRGNKRLFPLGLNNHERRILGILRNSSLRKVVLQLLANKKATHKALTNHLQTAPSAVSRYLNKLVASNVVVLVQKGREKEYRLKDESAVAKVLITYKESFVDHLVDKFAETWQVSIF